MLHLAVQIFELDTFKVTHASKYPAPVLSMGISPDCRLLAVGMADGMLSIRQHSRPHVVAADGTLVPASRGGQQRRKPRLTAANFRYFIRGQNAKAGATDFQVLARRAAKLQDYDKSLRKFQ